MKKKVLFILLFLLVSSSFFVSAQNQTDVSIKGYACLESKVANQCSSLSTEEKIFSVLTLGRCRTELNSDSLNNECWPNSGCTLKTTAQAILALGSGTKLAEDWLLSQAVNFRDIDWFLQVESAVSEGTTTSCQATYAGNSYGFSINDDRTLSADAGNCLTRYQDYWFEISSSCYNEQFEISCDKTFLTSLLYKKDTSATFYVSDQTHSASASGTTSEKVNSLCFTEGTSCSYEGTLWAALVLKNKKYNISSYLPYLVSQMDENERYLPESFLYSLTGGFKPELLAKQIGGNYWEVSGDRFYDTAAALLPFQNLELAEKTSSKEWLEEVQDAEGCWQGNLRNTAFILYSLWPKKVPGPSGNVSGGISDVKDCEAADFFCMPASSCDAASGTVLDDYTGCFAGICCNKPKQLESCANQGGELCTSSEQCLDGTTVESSDSNSGKFCCTKGVCGQQKISPCEINAGICRITCNSNEKLSPYACSGSNLCCAPKKFNWALVLIVLIVLILLAVLGIIFRKKLRDAFLNFKTKFKFKGKPSSPSTIPGRLPSVSSSRIPAGAVQRRIIPQQQRASARPVQKKSDFDDVLKKLKEIGK